MDRSTRASRSRPLAALSLALASWAVVGAAHAQEFPPRKPGLWELTMQTTNMPSQSIRQCIDERTDAQLQRMGQGMGDQQCTKNTFRKDGDKYVGESECKVGASVATSRAVFGGDFDKAYRGEIDVRYAPAVAGVSQTRMTISARWASACPAGWKPGDMEMPGMGRMNVNELMAGRAPKQK